MKILKESFLDVAKEENPCVGEFLDEIHFISTQFLPLRIQDFTVALNF